jgi:hypothetical protein
MTIRLLTVACLCVAGLQIAIWSGLLAGWSTLVGNSLAATKLARAIAPRAALMSPAAPSAASEELRKLHDALKQTSAAEQQLLAQESARAEALDRLAAARLEIQMLEARRSGGAEELAQERARAEALDRDLAAARQEIQTLRVDQANAAQDAPAAEPTRAREWVRGASNDPGPTSHAIAAADPTANAVAALQQSDAPSAAEPVPAFAPAEAYDTPVRGDAIHHLDSNEIAALLKRGDALIASGDLAAARLVLQRAADAGDAHAAMTLAETYDPTLLEKLGVHGVVPDLATARGWYEKARKFGATGATQRLELLASRQH